MSSYDLMRRATELDQHRQTLIREIADIHTLIDNAMQRLATVQGLIAGDAALQAMWDGALSGDGEGDGITEKDIGDLVATAASLKATTERINAKSQVFWKKEGPPAEDLPKARE